MRLFVPKELHPDETRIPLIPDHVALLVNRGAQVAVESGLGAGIGYDDDAYTAVGAEIVTDRSAELGTADMVLRLGRPPIEEVSLLKAGAIHISYLDPFTEHALQDAFMAQGVSAIAMEMLPRTTLAQKMDALSSQANLAGYFAVILASERLDMVLPMMMTPAGTLKPARVFVIGCGVAGLQAIATAKRLGARVDAFDTRPAVAEQVQSLGAKFVKVDLGETGETKHGYAVALSEDQLARQREAMAKVIAQSDIVITTAQLFGRPAPRIVTEEMVASMRPGSVIVDLAVDSGGNVAGSRAGEEVEVGGVRIIGLLNLPGRVALHASQMYSANISNLVGHFWDNEAKAFNLNLQDEILDGCCIVHQGELRSDMIRDARNGA